MKVIGILSTERGTSILIVESNQTKYFKVYEANEASKLINNKSYQNEQIAYVAEKGDKLSSLIALFPDLKKLK